MSETARMLLRPELEEQILAELIYRQRLRAHLARTLRRVLLRRIAETRGRLT